MIDIEKIKELVVNGMKPVALPDHKSILLVPEGHTPQLFDPLDEKPKIIAENRTFINHKSFVFYLNRFKNSNSLLFAKETENCITAVLDYHGPDAPEWGQHTATFKLIPTTEWKRWLNNDRRAFQQIDFVTFLEDNIDRVLGDQAKLLEVATHLKGKKNVRFESGYNAHNGALAIQYVEDVQGTSKNGNISVPEEFKISLPPYKGFDNYVLPVRLKYRVDEGKIFFIYQLVNPDLRVEDCFQTVCKDIGAEAEIEVLYC